MKKLLSVVFLCVAVGATLWGGATFSRVKSWSDGETLTASDLNAEFDNILNNLGPTGVDDASTDATAMQTTADPYPGSSISLPTNLAGELQRLRYMIKQISGESQWYVDVDTDIASFYSTARSQHKITSSASGSNYALNVSSQNGSTVMFGVRGDGVITISSNTSVKGFRAAAWSVPSLLGTIPFDSEAWDTQSNFDVGGGSFTCTVDGYYLISVMINLASPGTGSLGLVVRVNSTNTLVAQAATSGLATSCSVVGMVPLTAGQVVDVQAANSAGGSALTVGQQNNWVMIEKIR